MKNYELDHCWYFTSPGLAWDACLKESKIKLELLTDINMLLMIEAGIRGGVSMIPTRYSNANNKYMGSKYNPDEESIYIQYLDANNLYGQGMSKPLPVRNFKWMNEKELENWERFSDQEGKGCILEVDLEYPKALHDLHNDFPLAPERLKTKNKVDKLILNLNNKTRYVIHHENLKQYLDLGMKVKKIHSGISFPEKAWMKSYIDKNTELRVKEGATDFDKDLFKLMNN